MRWVTFPLGLVDRRVKALRIDGVEPSIENIQRQSYKMIRPFLFVFKTEPQGLAKGFLEFILSEAGQKILVQEGLISVHVLSPSLAQAKSP